MRKAFHRQCSRRLSGKGLRAAGQLAGLGVAGSSSGAKGSDALGGPVDLTQGHEAVGGAHGGGSMAALFVPGFVVRLIVVE